jgi:hypothetical protein
MVKFNTLDIRKGGSNLLDVKTWVAAAATIILLGVVAVGVAGVSKKVETIGTIEGMQNALAGLGR